MNTRQAAVPVTAAAPRGFGKREDARRKKRPCPSCAKEEAVPPRVSPDFAAVPLKAEPARALPAVREGGPEDDEDPDRLLLKEELDAGAPDGGAAPPDAGAAPADAGPGDAGVADAGVPAAPACTAATWKTAAYSAVNTNAASTTLPTAFTIAYSAKRDDAAKLWRMNVDSLEGGATIEVHTGGSRDPGATPPTSEAEAKDAVKEMKGYYARGRRGTWHTEAASKQHELHHYREWKCSFEHYWAIACPAIQALNKPVADHANAASASAAMKPAADAKLASCRSKTIDYYKALKDNANSPPFAAGQLILNASIIAVQALAASKSWTVEAGTNSPSAEPVCYDPFPAYTP